MQLYLFYALTHHIISSILKYILLSLSAAVSRPLLQLEINPWPFWRISHSIDYLFQNLYKTTSQSSTSIRSKFLRICAFEIVRRGTSRFKFYAFTNVSRDRADRYLWILRCIFLKQRNPTADHHSTSQHDGTQRFWPWSQTGPHFTGIQKKFADYTKTLKGVWIIP